jgi:anti-sigma factor RsiW
MSDHNPALAETSDIDEEIVAYLDGELDPRTSAQVEQRLSDDPAYRARLAQLQRTWDLLDNLHRTEADDDFVNSTVAMVAVQEEIEARTQRLLVVRRRNYAWVGLAVLLLVAVGVSFFVVHRVVTRDQRDFVRDLPVIEHVDEYRYIDSLDFLKSLERENLFAAEVDDGQ